MNENDTLMQQINAALEAAPDVTVPEDFAARVMARVPQAPKRATRRMILPSIRRTRYGPCALIAAMALLVAAMLVYAPQSGSNLGLAMQLILLAQCSALALWFATLRRT